MAKRDLINITDLSLEELESLLSRADDIADRPEKYSQSCKGKKLATLFYEPSTRTRLSFESAMLELGGSVIGFSDSRSSSATKGETVEDTARVVSYFADIIATRHFLEGAALAASESCDIPVINAGDGGHFHPTQTLTDLFTIHREKEKLTDFTVGIVGDLKYGRTVHSLISALLRNNNISFCLISPEELKLPGYIKREMDSAGVSWMETDSLESAMPDVDVLYMTRIQEERFSDRAEFERLRDTYVLDLPKMRLAKEDMIVLHPLPRVNEIAPEVDGDLRAKYFDQVGYGKVIRKALILSMLDGTLTTEDTKKQPSDRESFAYGHRCGNPKCIRTAEANLPQKIVRLKDGSLRCLYCDHGLE